MRNHFRINFGKLSDFLVRYCFWPLIYIYLCTYLFYNLTKKTSLNKKKQRLLLSELKITIFKL